MIENILLDNFIDLFFHSEVNKLELDCQLHNYKIIKVIQTRFRLICTLVSEMKKNMIRDVDTSI